MQDPTFDIVVLTTFDEAQKLSFEHFLDEFRHKHSGSSQKYKNVEFFVFVDVDFGVKLGSGGAVLFALHYLGEKFGRTLLAQKRILIIPVGGMSQRQVNGSILGKIFNLAPLAPDHETTFFDIKMMCYEKLVPLMPSGVLIAASDILEFYEDMPKVIDPSAFENVFNKNGFTVLAFKSNLKTAFNHGCYIFDRKPEQDSRKFVEIRDDIRLVLQKPTINELIENQACYIDQKTSEKYTYIDGVFFVGFDATETLINFIRSENFRIDSEICTFGDFLRPLGRHNTMDYAKSETQKKLFHLLRPFSIRGLIFRNSEFYHMGTFSELLSHYCNPQESSFMKNFANRIEAKSNSKFLPKKFHASNNECPNSLGLESIKGCVMSSVITDDSIVPQICILEKCYAPNGIEILAQNSAILSNISCLDRLIIDRSIVMCTMSLRVPVDGKITNQNITVVFSLSTDVKKEYADLESFNYFDRPLLQWMRIWNHDRIAVYFGDRASLDDQIFGRNPKTLWYARIFPGFSTMEESCSQTWKAVQKLTDAIELDSAKSNGNGFRTKEIEALRFFSMDDAFRMKNVSEMLKYRHMLLTEIIGDLE